MLSVFLSSLKELFGALPPLESGKGRLSSLPKTFYAWDLIWALDLEGTFNWTFVQFFPNSDTANEKKKFKNKNEDII